MNRLLTVILTILALGLFGCDREETIVIDNDPVPATPQGVFSVTGDRTVWVFFNGIYEHDVDYYTVYRSLSETTGYVAIANVDAEPNPNLDLLIYEYEDIGRDNGETYWYAVTAVDHAGQESDLSAENVFDTPRPEGQASMYPRDIAPALAGFNLATATVINWDSPPADIWVDRVVDTIAPGVYDVYPYLNAGVVDIDVDIQDLGYTESFDEISYATLDGWSLLGYAEAIEGHTYVIWTEPDNYAKVRITSITPSGAILFQWAYQTATSNLELAPPVRPERDRDNPQPKSTVVTQLLK